MSFAILYRAALLAGALGMLGAAAAAAEKPLKPGEAPPRLDAEPLTTPFKGPTVGPFRMCGIDTLGIEDLRAEVAKAPGVDAETEADGTGITYGQPKLARVWFFTEKRHRAHPAVACRTVAGEGEDLHIEMEFVCNGLLRACRNLKRDFEAANERVRATMKGGHSLQ